MKITIRYTQKPLPGGGGCIRITPFEAGYAQARKIQEVHMQMLKVAQIAQITGKTPKTIHNHRNAGKLSMEKDQDNEYAASVAEVQRAYGGIPDIADRIQNYFGQPPEPVGRGRGLQDNNQPTENSETIQKYMDIIKLKDQEIERMREDHERSLGTIGHMTKLLEHSTSNAEKLMASMEKVMERDAKREQRREARIREKKAEQEARSNQPFWKKIFG